ncbi:MAG: asparagine synthase (glutamine-hydrolyzing) [Deltaproteobacteria bacterium]|nr:asparagine synthase (glutamine-hydrolyzing) [Deltaproteobacteria bacterium]
MCGICGTVGFGSDDLIRRMAAMLAHRGPDDDGFFDGVRPPVHLANRRLTIIDLARGRQPLANEDGSVVAVQNGEIYNFHELRRELEGRGHVFCTQSDTEVIPHLYEDYGVDFARHLDGMFALAVWDARARRLVLVRDHMGIKPLYLWESPQGLAFASEVKAFLPLDGFVPRIRLDALHFLLNIRFIPGDQSLFDGVRKLPPGGRLVWTEGVVRQDRYWVLDVEPDAALRRPEDCVAETRTLLERAVKKQLVSDVPLGLYLSGGIDSSALVAIAARCRPGRVQTFTLGFGEPTDELEDARLVAEAFGTDHHEETISFDALSLFPTVTWHVEEPKENAIQLYVLAREARKHVKVALSGLGGDELFGGYRIFDFLRPVVPLHRLVGREANRAIVWPIRKVLALMAGSLGSMRLDLFRRGLDYALSAGVPERAYLLLRNMWEHDRRLSAAIYTPAAAARIEAGVEAFFTPMFDARPRDFRESVLRAEVAYKMVDDFLMNEDRTSMANGLEVRVPVLDKDLVEFAFSIPAAVKLSRGLKTVLKEAMRPILPPRTLAKPKWGFTFDSFQQFRKDLLPVARRELTREFVDRQGLFNFGFLDAIMRAPPQRSMRWHYFLLWLILGVKVWEELFLRGKRPEAVYDVAG